MKPWQHILLGILLGLLFAGIILLFILPQRGTPIPLVTVTANPSANTTPEAETIKVELAGAVKQPGHQSGIGGGGQTARGLRSA